MQIQTKCNSKSKKNNKNNAENYYQAAKAEAQLVERASEWVR